MSDTRPLHLAGGRLAALSVGDQRAPTWLALHGWLDNAASFSRLAPRLAERLGIHLVAIDFAGHGLSAPLQEGCDYAIWDYCHDVLDALASLELKQATLLSHSMGAGVACLTAAAFPEHVSRLVLIDGVGTLTTPASDAHTQLRKGLKGHRRPVSPAPRYADIESAVAARVAGGATPIDADTARPLVMRNLRALADGHQQLRTDGRLLRPSLVRFCPEQVLAMLTRIACPVLLVEGEQGILAQREHAAMAREAIPALTRRVLPGGHHLHLEAGAVDAVSEAIVAWHRT